MAADRIRVFRFSETAITEGQDEVNTFLETVGKVHSVTGNIAPQTMRDSSKSLTMGRDHPERYFDHRSLRRLNRFSGLILVPRRRRCGPACHRVVA